MSKSFNNMWQPGRTFADATSHYYKFTKESIQQYFGLKGPFHRHENVPNWLKAVVDDELKYQWIYLDPNNDEQKEWPFYLSFRAKPNVMDFEAPDPGKGKAVAFWNHELVAPGVMAYTEDSLKNIMVDAEGNIHALPSRMQAFGKGHSYSQLRLTVEGLGEVPITPFVVLGFFMWLETDNEDAKAVRAYCEKIGWRMEEAA